MVIDGCQVCTEKAREQKQEQKMHLEMERQEAARSLFELTDLKLDRFYVLVGGDWNMTFIFPYTGKNNPN